MTLMQVTRATDGASILRLRSGLAIRLADLAAAALLVAVGVAIVALSAGTGSTPIALGDLVGALFGAPLSEDQSFALWSVRLPRVAVGFMAGWCVALTGAMLQSLARNPLADPGLFGLNQGSMVMIMLLLVLVPEVPRALIPIAALGGGLAVALLLIWLVRGERTGGLAILLMGIAVETVLSSVASILILYTPREISYGLSAWLAGSLFQATAEAGVMVLPWFMLSLLAAFLSGPSLRAHDLGGELALALGEPVARSRFLVLILAVALSSAAVTAVGPLVFLGVMAPHLAGFLSAPAGRARLYLSGLTGGLMVVGADALSRGFGDVAVAMPVGLSLTILGVPLFILSLRLRGLRARRSE